MPVEKNFKRQVRQRMAETGERYTVARMSLELVGEQRRPTTDDPAVAWLLGSREPAVRYRTLTEVLGKPDTDSDVRAARAAIPDGPAVRGIFASQRPDGLWGAGAFGHKYSGTAHVLALLAQFRVSGDDARLAPALDFWMSWLTTTRDRVATTVEGRVRYPAGREGMAVDTLCLFGMAADPRLREHVDFLLSAQWPDGGWNGDTRPQARASSFTETFDATRGLFRYAALTGDESVHAAALASTDVFVKHGVIRDARSGNLLSGRITQLHWPRGYDVLHALEAIAPAGLHDARLAEALELIESKRGKDGRWRANGPKPKVNPSGPGEVINVGAIRDEMVTLRALSVLSAAGRTAPAGAASLTGPKPSIRRAVRRTSSETLDALLLDAGTDARVLERRALANDITGTYFRVLLDDGSTRLYREYATTSHTANKRMAGEIAFASSMRTAGLPVPALIGQVAGSAAAGGDPAAALFEDLGGEPLAFYGGHRKATQDDLFLSVTGAGRDRLWASVGAMLGALHRLDVDIARVLASPTQLQGRNTAPKDVARGFAGLLSAVGQRHPEVRTTTDALASLDRDVRSYLDARPVAIRSSEFFLPMLMLDEQDGSWACRAWVGWDLYASVGDPMRDVATIERLVRVWTGADLPNSFYASYGHPIDHVVLLVIQVMNQCAALTTTRSKRTEARGYAPHELEVDPTRFFPDALDRLREGLARA